MSLHIRMWYLLIYLICSQGEEERRRRRKDEAEGVMTQEIIMPPSNDVYHAHCTPGRRINYFKYTSIFSKDISIRSRTDFLTF